MDDKLTVKVSDSALSKDLFPDDYHWMGEAESRPIKWMPPEAILMFNRGAVATDMVSLYYASSLCLTLKHFSYVCKTIMCKVGG